MFKTTDGFVTEAANQSAGKARQAWNFGCFKAVVEGFDRGQWIVVVLLNDFAALVNINAFATDSEMMAVRQADKGVTAKTFAADSGFEWVGIGMAGESEIKRKRRIQVDKELSDERDAVMALDGLGLISLFADHVSLR